MLRRESPDDPNVLTNYTRYRVTADLMGVEKKDYCVLSTDATDNNPPDGCPDIPADGVSSCKVMIQKKNGETDLDMTAPEDNDLIELRTQRGRLSAEFEAAYREVRRALRQARIAGR